MFRNTLVSAESASSLGGFTVSATGPSGPSEVARAAALGSGLAYHIDDSGAQPLFRRKKSWRKRRIRSKFAKKTAEEDEDDFLGDFEVDEATPEGRPSRDRGFRSQNSTVQIAKRFISREIIERRRSGV